MEDDLLGPDPFSFGSYSSGSFQQLNEYLNRDERLPGEKLIDFIEEKRNTPGLGVSYNGGNVKVSFTLKF